MSSRGGAAGAGAAAMISQQDLAKYAAHIAPGEMEPDEEDARRPNPFPYSESEDVVLPEDYMPTKHDVINGRGRKSYNHIANRRFRQLIAMNLNRYLAARCKVDKTLVVVGIVNTIRNATPTGGFLKRCPKRGRWVSMSDESAREKVGHCLRDMIASQRDDKKTGKSNKINASNAAGAAAAAASAKNSKKNSSSVEPPPLAAMGAAAAAAAASDPKPRSPVLNPWLHHHHAAAAAARNPADALSLHHPPPISRDAPFASMWSAVKNEITANDVGTTTGSGSKSKQQQQQQQQLVDDSSSSTLPPLTGGGGGGGAGSGSGAGLALAGGFGLGGGGGGLGGGLGGIPDSLLGSGPPDPPPAILPLNLNNLDTITLQKGNLQDMSEQQRKILIKLENGFKGSVEELMEAVKTGV